MFKLYRTYRKKAFTLAEVLVTLTIIGVVAAMTVPTLMRNYEKIQFQSGFKKAYSEVNQAIKLMVNDEGENLDYKYFLYEFKGYFKKLEDYGDMAIGDVKNTFKSYKSFKNDQAITAGFYDDYLFTLSDGVDVFINADNYKPPVQLMVDTNGNKKGPNRLGYDFFVLVEYLPEEGFVIAGSEKSTFKNPDVYCSFESDNEANGKGCAFKALTDPNYWKNLK